MNATGQMLAGLLNWPQATFASRIAVNGDLLDVTREVDGGTQSLQLKLPALITADLRLNSPRYASLPNIMKAKKKPLTETTPDTLGVNVNSRLTIMETREAPRRQSGKRVKSATDLVAALRSEVSAFELNGASA